MSSIWNTLALFDFGIQWVGFGISYLFRTELFYDLTGSLSYITVLALTAAYKKSLSQSQKIQIGLTAIWAIRLGAYLFIRILKSGEDKRFRSIKKSIWRLFIVWNLQGIWVLVTLYPTLEMALKLKHVPIKCFNVIGWLLFLIGLGIEVIADQQKWNFKANITNKGEYIHTGLWKYCRHPNYFGEILLWSGMYLSSWSHLTSFQERSIALISPIFITMLLIKASGIPLLEKSADRQWGSRLDYQNYKKNTPCLIPFIW